MFDAFIKISPILATFALGYLLKRLKLFKAEDGSLLLKILFFVVAPALIYISTSSLEITPHFLVFPLIAGLTMLSIYLINVLVTKSFDISRKTLGTYFVGTLVANTAFVMPFFLAVYGIEAISRVAMYDLTNGLLIFTFVYSLAVRYGKKRPSNKFIIQKVLVSPPLWALLLGLIVNFAGIRTPEIILTFLNSLAGTVSPLIMLALGFFFNPKLFHPKLIVLGIITRMIGGLVIGYILASAFHLERLDKLVAIVCTSAPVGFITLTFSNMEDLDTEFAASLVSIGIVFGLFLVPLLMVILK